MLHVQHSRAVRTSRYSLYTLEGLRSRKKRENINKLFVCLSLSLTLVRAMYSTDAVRLKRQYASICKKTSQIVPSAIRPYLTRAGATFLACSAAIAVTLASCSCLILRTYLNSITNMSSTLSFVIMRIPCTSIPFMSCGAMPLNKPSKPSFLTMNRMTSGNDLKGLPILAGGGLDCRPTFATMSGCVQSVANDFDMAPRTECVSVMLVSVCMSPLTKSLMRCQADLAWVYNLP